MKYRKASILILTLWVLSFLAVFAVGLSRSVSAQLRLAAHFQNRLKMYYLANAGIERAIVELRADEDLGCDNLSEKWANSEEFEEIPLGDGYLVLSIEDEAGKININKVSLSVLKRVLESTGGIEPDAAADIANAIVDWRDADIIISTGGAENDYYEHLQAPYPCKNGAFQIPEEVLLVKGMTPQIYSKIAGVITVYGGGKVNVNTVDAGVLGALGLSGELANRIVEFRRGDDKIEGTDDDNVFKTPAEIRNVGPLFTEEAIEINRLTSGNVLTVRSNTFRIFSTGIIKKGKYDLQRSITCVVQRLADKPFGKLYWHED